MTTDSLDWALLALGAAGAEFAVLSPLELRDRMQAGGALRPGRLVSGAGTRP